MIVNTETSPGGNTFENIYNCFLKIFPLDEDVKEKDSTTAYNYVMSTEIATK